MRATRGRAPDGRAWNTLSLAERIEIGIDRSAGADACWPWQGDKTKAGYPQVTSRRRKLYVHRIVADAQPGEEVLHSCDNPPCCNGRHLSKGTHLDNIKDMLAKGRAKPWGWLAGRKR